MSQFTSPPNILKPFEEPSLENQVTQMASDLHFLIEPIKALVKEVHEEVVNNRTSCSRSPSPSKVKQQPAEQAAPASSTATTEMPGTSLSVQELMELVQKQQKTIEEQQRKLSARRRRSGPTPGSPAASTVDSPRHH